MKKLIPLREKFLKSLKSKWPATILAHNRTDKVIGRIMLETISIKTMKFIKRRGVPIGTKWAIISFVLFFHPKIIKEIQIQKEAGKEIIMWAVGVKIKGNRAKKFTRKIDKNRDIKIIKFPFLMRFPKRGLISFIRGMKNNNLKITFFLLIQYLPEWNNMNNREEESQGKLVIKNMEGSKMENRFVIMISFLRRIIDNFFCYLILSLLEKKKKNSKLNKKLLNF